jgi:hypothetical protein
MDDHAILANSEAVYLDACTLVKIEKAEEDRSCLVRLLVYGSSIPMFSSFIGFGEFLSVLGREERNMAGVDNYLYSHVD